MKLPHALVTGVSIVLFLFLGQHFGGEHSSITHRTVALGEVPDWSGKPRNSASDTLKTLLDGGTSDLVIAGLPSSALSLMGLGKSEQHHLKQLLKQRAEDTRHRRCARRGGINGTVVMLRTSADAILAPAAAAWAVALDRQLCSGFEVLIDTTVCGGAACDAEWHSHRLGGVPVYTISAGDIGRRWPDVKWPILGMGAVTDDPKSLQNPPSNDSNACTAMHDQIRCWLLNRLSIRRTSLRNQRWPMPPDGLVRLDLLNSDTNPEDFMLQFLIHEPSVIMWLEARIRKDIDIPDHVWLIEDDTIFTGDALTFFKMHALDENADMLSTFMPWSTDCMRGMFHGPWPGAANDSVHCERLASLPLDGDSRPDRSVPGQLQKVHHWEHLVRLSRRLLDYVKAELDASRVAHGELFASTICHMTEGCVTKDLRQAGGLATDFLTTDSTKFPSLAALPDDGRWYHVDNVRSLLFNFVFVSLVVRPPALFFIVAGAPAGLSEYVLFGFNQIAYVVCSAFIARMS